MGHLSRHDPSGEGVMPRERKPPPFDADPWPKFPKCKCGTEQGIVYKPEYFAWCCDACGKEGKR